MKMKMFGSGFGTAKMFTVRVTRIEDVQSPAMFLAVVMAGNCPQLQTENCLAEGKCIGAKWEKTGMGIQARNAANDGVGSPTLSEQTHFPNSENVRELDIIIK